MRTKHNPGNAYRALYQAHMIAEKLAKLDKMDEIEQFGPLVLNIMDGVRHDVWVVLDEKPGLFGYMDDRFYMLRRVRNDRTWGEKLFAGLSKK